MQRLRKDQWHGRVLEILLEVLKQDKITSTLVLSEAVTMMGGLAGDKKESFCTIILRTTLR
ncbi:MAG TPA: hypothetical protein PKI66_09125 [Methanobacteriaceae archaeon]|nr:hypothetical protein [Methanobacteriaceae archaeon]